MEETKEYAFDITLAAVVRVVATSEEAARTALSIAVDCLDLTSVLVCPEGCPGVKSLTLTEASLMWGGDTPDPRLFQINGVETGED